MKMCDFRFGSDNGLAPFRPQAIIWTNDVKFSDAFMHQSASMSLLTPMGRNDRKGFTDTYVRRQDIERSFQWCIDMTPGPSGLNINVDLYVDFCIIWL